MKHLTGVFHTHTHTQYLWVIIILFTMSLSCGKQNNTKLNSTQNAVTDNPIASTNNKSSTDVGKCFTVNYEPISLPGNSDNSIKIVLISANLPNGPFFSPAGTGCNTSAFVQSTIRQTRECSCLEAIQT